MQPCNQPPLFPSTSADLRHLSELHPWGDLVCTGMSYKQSHDPDPVWLLPSRWPQGAPTLCSEDPQSAAAGILKGTFC